MVDLADHPQVVAGGVGRKVAPAGSDQGAHPQLPGHVAYRPQDPRAVEHRHAAEAEIDGRLAGVEPGQQFRVRHALADPRALLRRQQHVADQGPARVPLRQFGHEERAVRLEFRHAGPVEPGRRRCERGRQAEFRPQGAQVERVVLPRLAFEQRVGQPVQPCGQPAAGHQQAKASLVRSGA
ncbi:hypothetical protein Val02_22970 [Virgisporangium aliadipatigenens]|uniref:Uncharacterized protein n=1 Tax=Virgisporangium aliadipatigenens TaxID=741659 RepID=A0A8J3YK54_9ACTN|nr:hypothetical protein [Virgisporangium aliadipatigenens]GIJ45411.1 hypothetical protein Val02_22970 [Virgisporangium aliadipatigenens]